MPEYRQSKSKSKKTNPYKSVKMRTSKLGGAKSTPTKRSKKSRSKIRRIRSAPVRSRRKSMKSTKSKKRKELAESVYGRFQSPAEVEMKYLKTIHDKYDDEKDLTHIP